MGRFEPTGPVDVPGLEHSVANLSWGVLRGALGPSDGTAGAASNVPSALGVLRHADIYKGVPDEIEEAFAVLERHVVRDGQLYPVVVAALPFLFATIRKAPAFVATRIADLIALYASTAHTLETPLDVRVRQLVSDHGGEIARWLGHHDRALGAIAIHVPALRDIFIAAVEGAERVSPEILLALVELGEAPGETPQLALAMFDGPDSPDITRTAAAAFLARFGDHPPELRTRIDAALPPSATTALRRLAGNLWNPVIVRPVVAPKLYDAEVLFTGKKVVVVKAASKSVTLPWEGAALAQGDRLQVGLSAHGQPKLVVVTDRKGNVRVIDF